MKKRIIIKLICVLSVFCLLAGCFNVKIELPRRPASQTEETGSAYNNGTQPYVYETQATQPNVYETESATQAQPVTQPVTQAAVTEAPPTQAQVPVTEAPKTPDMMSNAELLAFFNESLNRIKAQNVGFTKYKLTSILDLQLSNSAANAVVGLVKSSLLTENGETTNVQRGSSGVNVFSPSGKNYVSTLTLDDLTSINCTRNGSQYIIKLGVKGETNPGEGSIMSRGFDYMTVDDVVNIYAPKVGATVSREDISVVFSDCTATLTVNADGIVSAYTTYVKGVMNMKNASIKKVITINTDLAVTLASTTEYSNFAY